MSNRLLLAGIVGGLVLFVWGAVSHMALPIGEAGIQALPNEGAVLAALKEQVKGPGGLYLFPYQTDPAKMEQAVKENPRGLLTITPAGTPFSMGASLGVQCLNDILIGLLLAWVLSKAAPQLPGLGAKLAFAAVVAAIASLGYLGPFWNWYGFTPVFVAAGTVDAIIGLVLGALTISKMMRW